MVKGKTKSGFKFEANEKLMHSVSFLMLFREVQKGEDGLLIFDLLEQVLGKEQLDRLIDHIRDEDGFDDIDKMTEEMVEIFERLAEAEETKN